MSVLDFHAWIEIGGKVIDWDMKSKNLKAHLEFCSLVNNGSKEFEPIHIEWTDIDEQTQQVLDNMISKREDELKLSNESDRKMIWNNIKNKPMCCLNRAILLKIKNPSAVIKFGSLGLKDKKGNIWYEFGNGSKRPLDNVKHIKIR